MFDLTGLAFFGLGRVGVVSETTFAMDRGVHTHVAGSGVFALRAPSRAVVASLIGLVPIRALGTASSGAAIKVGHFERIGTFGAVFAHIRAGPAVGVSASSTSVGRYVVPFAVAGAVGFLDANVGTVGLVPE